MAYQTTEIDGKTYLLVYDPARARLLAEILVKLRKLRRLLASQD